MTANQRTVTRRDLVIDTNILLLLIGYQSSLAGKLGVGDRIDLLEELRGQDRRLSPERFDDLWNFFNSGGRRLVTQHVIAEVWARGLRHESFRGKTPSLCKAMIEVLSHSGIEETSLEVRAMCGTPEYRKIADTIGPTDAGVIYIAEKRRATILSEDGKLLQWAHRRSVPALQLGQIGLE